MNILGEIMENNNFTNDNVEVIYNKNGESFQELMQKAFDIYLRVGSYQTNKGDKHDV